jgi:putative drug exporter of the RND superfamily
VFVDATIVRMVLVPATMKLMGDANWWFPSWLDRIVPAMDIDGGAGLPEPEMEPADSPDDAPADAPAPDRERALV